MLVKGGQIDKKHPLILEFIALYKKLTGKTVGQGNCRNCIIDAFFELNQVVKTPNKLEAMTGKHKLKRMFDFGHRHYTNANMTDELAVKMVRENRRIAAYFENPDALLAEADSVALGKAPEVPKPTTKVVKQTATKTVSITEVGGEEEPAKPKKTVRKTRARKTKK